MTVKNTATVDETLFPQYTGKSVSKDYVRVDYLQPHQKRKAKLLETHPELSKLMQPYRLSGLYTVLIVVFQVAMAYYMRNWSLTENWLLIFGLAYTLGAVACHAQWVLIHDLSHNAVFASEKLNLLWHWVAGLIHIFPSSISFRYYHLMHHAYLNTTYDDPDMPSLLEQRIFGNSSLGKAMWLLLFPYIQSIRVLRYQKSSLFDFWIMGNFICCMSFNAWAFFYLGPAAFFYLFVSSHFAISLHPCGARWIAEHYAVRPNQETYSYYGPINKIAFNIGYHNEHHDLMLVPWVNLPKVRAMAPEFYDRLYYHTSYLRVLKEFIFNPNFSLCSRVVRSSQKSK